MYKKAFTIIEVAIVVAMLAVAGFAGYRYWDSRQVKKSESQETHQNSTSEHSNSSTAPEGWVKYNNDKYNISFYHPKDWDMTDKENDHPTISGRIIVLNSPHFESKAEAIGGTTTNKGGEIKISVYETDYETLGDSRPYNPSNPYTHFFKDKKYSVSKIDGVEAWQYNYDYEGDSPYVTEFITGGYYYSINFDGETSDEVSSELFDIYKQLLSTVEVE